MERKADMEELAQVCEMGISIVKLDRNWEKLDAAKELTEKYGYVEEEGGDEGFATFVKPEQQQQHGYDPVIDLPEAQMPPEAAEYIKGTRGTRSGQGEEGWTEYVSWQLDTIKYGKPIVLEARVPKVSKHQHVGIKLQVQPAVKLDSAHLTVRLRIECLTIGVSKNEALRIDEHGALGFYPSQISISFRPKLGKEDADAIARYIGAEDLDVETTNVTSATKAGLTVSMTPALVAEHSRSVEQQVTTRRTRVTKLVGVETGNLGGFGWRIEKWRSGGGTYIHDKPHQNLKLLGKLKLPFEGSSVRLDGQFAEVEWKFPPEFEQNLSFEVCIDMKMDLVWFKANKWFRVLDSRTVGPFSFLQQWRLLRSTPTQLVAS